jgi:uncharacterized protein
MAQPDILATARSWSFWDHAIPSSVPRDVDLPDELRDSLCLVIQGVRRCGKSTLLQQLVGRYELTLEHCAFLNFEDPRLTRSLSYETLELLVQQFRAQHPDAPQLTFFLDEIQEVDGWQRWLRTQLDRPRGHVFVVTGSNSSLLSGELGSVLTGRHLPVTLYPFDLAEVRRIDPSATLDTYLRDGGFPEPLTLSDGDRLLRQYFHDIVERDVRERLKARSSLAIRQVAQMVFESAGAEMSLRRIAAATGIAVDTAARYLEVCEDAHLLFSCPYFAFSERKRASMNRKYYPVDSGLRRVAITRTGADRGKALECATYLALRRRFSSVSYWRERGEVDFVVQHGGEIIPVQVTWAEPLPRHHAALESFYERFPQAGESVYVTAQTFEEALASLDGRGP